MAENKASPAENGIPEELKDEKHGIKMGVVSEKCDNGKVNFEYSSLCNSVIVLAIIYLYSFSVTNKANLTLDWNSSPVNHTCYSWKYPLPVDESIESYITCDTIPPGNYSVYKDFLCLYFKESQYSSTFAYIAASSLLHGHPCAV